MQREKMCFFNIDFKTFKTELWKQIKYTLEKVSMSVSALSFSFAYALNYIDRCFSPFFCLLGGPHWVPISQLKGPQKF